MWQMTARAAIVFVFVLGACGGAEQSRAVLVQPPDDSIDMGRAAADLAPPCEHWWECQPGIDGGATVAPDLAPSPGCGELGAVPCPGERCAPSLVALYQNSMTRDACSEPRAATCAESSSACGGVGQPPCASGCASGLYIGRAPDSPDLLCQPCP
jgi:hypothetical protein